MKFGKKNLLIMMSYIVLVATVPLTLIFNTTIQGKMNDHIQDTIQNAAVLCSDMVERQYENDELLLESLATRMSSYLAEDAENAVSYMVSTAERYGMKRIAYSLPDGTTYTTDKVDMDLTGVDNFERAIKGEFVLTVPISDVADGEEINVYSMPVYADDNKTIMGVLSAVYKSEKFRELLSVTAFDGEGYTYVIGKDGNVEVDTNHENAIEGMENIFDYLSEHGADDEFISELKNDIKNGKSGFMEVDSSNGEKFVWYEPSTIQNWYIFSVVPKAIAEQTKTAVMYTMMIYFMIISLVALFVVLSIRNEQKAKNKMLKKALYEDALTGGISYAKFKIDSRDRLDKEIYKHVACAFIDIDNFNLVATLYGIRQSDDTICRIYSMIKNCVGDKGIICRCSSDQFGIMYFYNDIEQLEASMRRFDRVLSAHTDFENMLRPTMGVYVVEDISESIDDMINKAKIAHESIKQNGNKRIAYYNDSFRNTLYENKHMEEEMEKALKNHEFVPYIQPKYNAHTGQICGGEALIRWITPDGNIISPGKFIPLAENNGFIRQLDKAMFLMVCELQKKLMDKGVDIVPISVNLSRQLMYEPSFADEYYDIITRLNIPCNMVQLEITESALFEDLDLFRATLDKLRNFGFRILMDDFGTGYSSLMMLKSMPIDEIKLDKTFVDDYNDEKGSSIICCVLDLANMLRLPVVAEGVETESQYEYLKQMGCDVIQGYYFSKPVAVEEYVQKLSMQ